MDLDQLVGIERAVDLVHRAGVIPESATQTTGLRLWARARSAVRSLLDRTSMSAADSSIDCK
jgi:hypothetical protein